MCSDCDCEDTLWNNTISAANGCLDLGEAMYSCLGIAVPAYNAMDYLPIAMGASVYSAA